MTDKNKEKDDYFNNEKSSPLRSIGGLITFSTILPLNIYTNIEEMAKMTWFWPVVSAFVGLIALFIGFILNILNFPFFVTSAIIYSFFIWFNGFHHLDGLMDVGDALMVHGSPEKKIKVMRDSMIGTGGIALFFIVAIISVALLDSLILAGSLAAILICEMSAKVGLVSCCITSKSGPNGTGKYFIESMTITKFVVALIIAIIIAYFFASFIGIFGVLGGVFGGSLMALIGKNNFEIATGDVLGASNEIGRLFSLLFMLIAFIMF
ncbi:adenosylcobinamide-GDP ribazoletransferase [Methanobrevibacter sp. TMH8]|uniref:adenosylcobinamide-GDP ribazoletransferase n=1 Tax=Methanobrevibacter sp. TMH8 TaxID=2848611 RepID=UPI001CCC2670|nr:adenosylcobinamide-GDP ribazoletransferase [Methanobrevibacter sp. TMH8]MBZ9571057.1 adenosylcobinamide-GDP ribazoletransferase [Methanobrevibacter sp. TMH8]